jgi:hypothetical protein
MLPQLAHAEVLRPCAVMATRYMFCIMLFLNSFFCAADAFTSTAAIVNVRSAPAMSLMIPMAL